MIRSLIVITFLFTAFQAQRMFLSGNEFSLNPVELVNKPTTQAKTKKISKKTIQKVSQVKTQKIAITPKPIKKTKPTVAKQVKAKKKIRARKTIKKAKNIAKKTKQVKEVSKPKSRLKVVEAKTFDRSLYKVDYEFGSWGIQPSFKDVSINVVKAWKNFNKRREVVVAVVDTGIDNKHPFLKNNLYVPTDKKISSKNYGVDFSKGTKNRFGPKDSHGHGTHISGIIRSIFPEVKILSLKYYNPRVKNKDNLTSTVKALEYAIEQNVDIINYSSGGAGASIDELRVLKKAEKKGILVVAAAGNEASNIDVKDHFYFPASYRLKNMITVINHNKKGSLNVSSNWGKRTADLSAPGSRIKSAFPKSRAGYLTGTSQATAFVSGVAALLMSQYPDLKAKDIKQAILKGSRKHKALANKCRTGSMLDAKGAQEIANKLSQGQARQLAQRKAN